MNKVNLCSNELFLSLNIKKIWKLINSQFRSSQQRRYLFIIVASTDGFKKLFARETGIDAEIANISDFNKIF